MTTGYKEARFNPGSGVAVEPGSDREAAIRAKALRAIADDDERASLGDGPTVRRRLAAAAAWNDAALVRRLLRTCYVTVGQASEVLYAVAGRRGTRRRVAATPPRIAIRGDAADAASDCDSRRRRGRRDSAVRGDVA